MLRRGHAAESVKWAVAVPARKSRQVSIGRWQQERKPREAGQEIYMLTLQSRSSVAFGTHSIKKMRASLAMAMEKLGNHGVTLLTHALPMDRSATFRAT